MKKVNVLYLSTKYTKISSLKNFILNYRKFKPGLKHQLVICFKNLDLKELKERKKLLKKIEYQEYIDPSEENDHEWGSIKRVSKKLNPSIILYLNDHSYPIKNNWLKIISGKYKKKRIIGCSASMSSWATNSFFRHYKDNYFMYFYKYFYFNKFVPKFPNPHLRSNGILFHTSDYLNFIKGKKAKNRMNSYILESGYKGFTNFFKSKNYEILVVNSDGKLFEEKKWKFSNTYAYKDQQKLLISDKNTRDYLNLNFQQKKKKQRTVWGSN